MHGNDELVALRLHYFTFISSNVVLRVPEAIAATRHDDTRGFAHLFYILRVCRERTALLLPELAVVTQWTSERPAQPPPLPTFTIDLPAIFADVSRRGYLSRAATRAAVRDIDYFTYPRFWPKFLDIKGALVHGDETERRCAQAVLGRLPTVQRALIRGLPWPVLDVLAKVRAVLWMKRALELGPDDQRRFYREKFAELAVWKRLVVVTTPIRTVDRAIAATRRLVARIGRPIRYLDC